MSLMTISSVEQQLAGIAHIYVYVAEQKVASYPSH